MDLLLYLARNSNRVVSKDELIDAIWRGVFVTDEVLTNSIYKLRQALGDDPKKPSFIKTVPRRGYQLIAPVSLSQNEKERYRVLDKIGEGGVAEVFLVEDRFLRRRVALKEIKLGMNTREIVARFQLEQDLLSVMDHPYIAKLHDSGITTEGRAFFVMEHVAGVPITDYSDRERLTVNARLRLFMKVCSAVAHAHRKGIIHRDIKPSNVLVAVQDREAVPKLIDFGLAKALGPRVAERTLFTQPGEVLMGSPNYMSPEQIAMSRDIDATTDIYSLGILLYRLLTALTPFGLERERAAGRGDLAHVVKEELIVPPSTRLRRLARGRRAGAEEDGSREASATIEKIAHDRGTNPRKLIGSISCDLDKIILRATEKDRTRRYETVALFERDLQLHLEHRPIAARAPDLTYRLGKFARRHRRALRVFASLLVGLLLSLFSLVYSRMEISRERDVSREARQRALEYEASARGLAYRASLSAAEAAIEQNDVELALKHLSAAPAELRGWEWTHLSSRSRQSGLTLTGLESPPRSLSLDSKANLLASIGSCEAIRVWDLESGRLLLEKPFWSACRRPVVSIDGRQVLILGFDADTGNSVIRMLNASNLDEIHRYSIPGYTEVDFGRMLAYSLDLAGSNRGSPQELGELSVRDIRSGEILASRAWATRFDHIADSDRLMRLSLDGSKLLLWKGLEAWVVEARSLKPLSRIHVCPTCSDRPLPTLNVVDGAITPDNHRVVLISGDSKIRVFNAANGKLTYERDSGAGPQLSVALSPTEPSFATAGQDHVVRLWRLEDGQPTGFLRGHRSAVNNVVFSADGSRLVTSGLDREIHLWQVPPKDNPIVLNAHQQQGRAVVWSRHANRLFTGGWDGIAASPGAVRMWTPEGRLLALAGADDGIVYSMALSPDSTQLAIGVSRVRGTRPYDHRLRILNARTGSIESVIGPFEFLRTSLTYHPRGEFILTGGAQLEIWHLPTRTRVHSFGDIDAVGGQSAYSPDGRFIAAGTLDSGVKVWNGNTFELVHRLDGHRGAILSLAFSRDASHLITAAEDKTIRVWCMERGAEVGQLKIDSAAPTHSMAFSPDGLRLVTGSKDGVIRVWDVQRLAEVVQLRGHSSAVVGLAWSPDGTRLASVSDDGAGRIWSQYR